MGNHNIKSILDNSQDNFIYCEICEINHINNAWCQAPYNEQEYNLWTGSDSYE